MFLIWLDNDRLSVDLHSNLEDISAIPEFLFSLREAEFWLLVWKDHILPGFCCFVLMGRVLQNVPVGWFFLGCVSWAY